MPGASVAAGISTGYLSLGAVGAVTYRDGNRLWAFGHALDDAGLRSLFLQDAYVYAVIGNPVGIGDLSTYKLAAVGRVRGTLSGDGPNAVAGTVGAAEPASTEVIHRARDVDTGKVLTLRSLVADETALGHPDGGSPLSTVAGLGAAAAGTRILGGSPAEQSGRMCARITLVSGDRSLRFCDRYAARGIGGADSDGAVPLAAADDITSAVGSSRAPATPRCACAGCGSSSRSSAGCGCCGSSRPRCRGRSRPASGSGCAPGCAAPTARRSRARSRSACPRNLKPGTRRLVLAGAAGPADRRLRRRPGRRAQRRRVGRAGRRRLLLRARRRPSTGWPASTGSGPAWGTARPSAPTAIRTI